MFMPAYSRNEVVLVRYPFTSGIGEKIRPAVVVSAPHISQDVIITPLTSRTNALLPGEFLLADWTAAGLNAPTSVKRGLYTLRNELIIKSIGYLSKRDSDQLEKSLRSWLGW
jgi:mRNA interferase MazF